MQTARKNEAGRTHDTAGSDWPHVDDLMVRARRERALWAGELTRRLVAWIRGHAPAGPTTWLARRRRAGEVRGLLALDDHTLADIGLRRDDLRGVVHGAVSLEQLSAARMSQPETPVVPFRPAAEANDAAPATLDRAA